MSQYLLRKADITLEDKYAAVLRFQEGKESPHTIAESYGVSLITLHGWRKSYMSEAIAFAKNAKKSPAVVKDFKDLREAVKEKVKEEKAPKLSADGKRQGVRYTEEQRRWALEEVQKGERLSVICEVLGVSYNTLKKWRDDAAYAKLEKSLQYKNRLLAQTNPTVIAPVQPISSKETPAPPVEAAPIASTASPSPVAPAPSPSQEIAAPSEPSIQDDRLAKLTRENLQLHAENQTLKMLYAEVMLELTRLKQG